jgi:tetratricopeptide (TPR) repeat protein
MSTTEPGTTPGTEPDSDADLETLEQEREFLLRSLADLDAEYEAGDIDDDDYRTLTDDYTVRAATVLRAIEATKATRSTKKRGPSSGPARPARSRPRTTAPATAATGPATTAPAPATTAPAPATTAPAPATTAPAKAATAPAQAATAPAQAATGPGKATTAPAPAGKTQRSEAAESALLSAALQSRRRWRTTAVIIVVLGFGVLAAWVVAQSSGSRQPGQTASGNAQITGTTVSGGVDQRLVTAADLVNQGKVADALKLYDQVLADDPNQPVALADGGWLQAQAGLAGNRSDLVDSGLVRIEKAEGIAPDFADAHFFRGFLLLRAKNDAPGAVTELRLYLGIVDPSAPQVPQVQTLLQEAIKAAGPSVPAGPNAPPTTTSKP